MNNSPRPLSPPQDPSCQLPLRRSSPPARRRATICFPWDRLDSRPLVYVSMGTLPRGLDWVFRTFAEACDELDVQLVLSLGGNLDPASFDSLTGSPIVVRFAPQLQLLERATLCIGPERLGLTACSVNALPLQVLSRPAEGSPRP